MEALIGQANIPGLLTLFVALLALVIAGLAYRRQATLLKRYRALLQGRAEIDVEEYLLGHSNQLEAVAASLGAAESRLLALEEAALGHLQKVAVVRYNAFSDTGSDLSFSIAILDGKKNGAVLSSLYGRTESRIYAKPIHGGKSRYALSDEEKAALAEAMGEGR